MRPFAGHVQARKIGALHARHEDRLVDGMLVDDLLRIDERYGTHVVVPVESSESIHRRPRRGRKVKHPKPLHFATTQGLVDDEPDVGQHDRGVRLARDRPRLPRFSPPVSSTARAP